MHTVPLTPLLTNSSGPPESVAVMMGRRARNASNVHVTEVFVEGRVQDRERVRVQLDELIIADRAGKIHAIRHTQVRR